MVRAGVYRGVEVMCSSVYRQALKWCVQVCTERDEVMCSTVYRQALKWCVHVCTDRR